MEKRVQDVPGVFVSLCIAKSSMCEFDTLVLLEASSIDLFNPGFLNLNSFHTCSFSRLLFNHFDQVDD